MGPPPLIVPASTPLMALLAIVIVVTGEPSHAQSRASLSIELNKIESTDQGCRPVFIFNNATGHQLDRLQIDLVLFDPDGVYAKQALLDMAPLYPGKKVVASFMLNETSCEEIGSILVNGLPACEAGSEPELDCLALLSVSSKTSIPLEK
jgi:hypothetical protein